MLCKQFGWSRVAIISTTDSFGSGLLSSFQLYASNNGIEILASVSFPTLGGPTSNLLGLLNIVKESGAWIIIVEVIDADLTGVLAAAAALDMIGPPYVWVGNSAIPDNVPFGGISTQIGVDHSAPWFQTFANQLLALPASEAVHLQLTPTDVYSALTYGMVGMV